MSFLQKGVALSHDQEWGSSSAQCIVCSELQLLVHLWMDLLNGLFNHRPQWTSSFAGSHPFEVYYNPHKGLLASLSGLWVLGCWHLSNQWIISYPIQLNVSSGAWDAGWCHWPNIPCGHIWSMTSAKIFGPFVCIQPWIPSWQWKESGMYHWLLGCQRPSASYETESCCEWLHQSFVVICGERIMGEDHGTFCGYCEPLLARLPPPMLGACSWDGLEWGEQKIPAPPFWASDAAFLDKGLVRILAWMHDQIGIRYAFLGNPTLFFLHCTGAPLHRHV